MGTGEDRLDSRLLQWTQALPPETVDDVVLDRGVQTLEGGHSFKSMSSTLEPSFEA